MKSRSLKLTLFLILVSITSCNEPETVVTDIVHSDGSVTRKIEMKSVEAKAENRFKLSDIQVPFDNTWTVKDSCEVSKKGDTTWVKRGVKQYKNVGEINSEYKADLGANKEFLREADFIKKFRWFNTICRFSEKIDKIMLNGYPIKNWLNQEEMKYFYSPETINSERVEGPDSLKYKALVDSIKNKTDLWALNSMVSEWISEFSRLTAGKEESKIMMGSLKSNEDKLVNLIRVNENNEKFDSLWSNGIILKDYLGEANYLKYKIEADTAAVKVLNKVINSFKGYYVKISMPGKVIGTNGFIDSSQVLLWQVKSDFFLTEPYEMWAESKMPNRWAWIVSGLFLAFVLTGVVVRVRKKG